MNDVDAKHLCSALMAADTEAEVISVLQDADLWNDLDAWRLYGDDENNYSIIGNQQARPDAALVEKFVNSIDHRLLNQCLIAGIDPEGAAAPSSIREAVGRFFDPKAPATLAGRVSNWSSERRTDIARGITLAATGNMPAKGMPSYTISDCGEGQTPDELPNTLLSLRKSNKLRIPFVQGKFNMGSTGVLKFCGRQGLQLILSRRNPKLLGATATAADLSWGFTVVRREEPAGGRRSSSYTYLAPIGTDKHPHLGAVLRFNADSMPIFPEGRNAYGKNSEWGTLIKVYEYASSGYGKSHILMKDGLMARIDLLLFDPALPIRFHECRKGYAGHAGSFETTLTGLSVRLDDNRSENLEDGFPSSCPINADGQAMTATIYAFKKGKAETYRKNEGIVFSINGQTHGHLTKDFFSRQKAGRLTYIADSILVTVDCSGISGRAREDLFMNSRDRLSNAPVRSAIEEQLEEMLKTHQGLRALKEKRRTEEIESKLAEEKPLEDILKSLLQHSPTLSNLFLKGLRAVNPFKTLKVTETETQKPFEGKKHPTFFKFKGKEYGKLLQRDCQINQRCRITFETDAANDYFSRSIDKGDFSLERVAGELRTPVSSYVGPNLQNGIATFTLSLPDNVQPGDELTFLATVSDPVLVDPFANAFTLKILAAEETGNGGGGKRHKPPIDRKGEERELPSGIALPNIALINEADWEKQEPPFNKFTALRVRITDENGGADAAGNESHDVYDFMINMDNIYLKSELKNSGDEVEMTRARWKYGLVLIGLALLHEEAQRKTTETEDADPATEEEDSACVEKRIESFTRAIGPILLPMISELGALDLDEASMVMSTSGGDVS